MRILLPLAALALVSSCASQIMQGYVGKSIQEPILDYGPPANVVDLNDGQRAFQWQIDSSGVIPISSPSTATVYGTGGYATVSTTTTNYVPYSNSCLYTLLARPNGDDFVVTGFRKPRLACE